MPHPAVSAKIKRLRRRFGITAPRVEVRQKSFGLWHVLVVVIPVFLLVAWFFWDQGRSSGLGNEVGLLRSKLTEQQAELEILRTSMETGQSAMGIDVAMRRQLADRIAALEAENAALREDSRLLSRLSGCGNK